MRASIRANAVLQKVVQRLDFGAINRRKNAVGTPADSGLEEANAPRGRKFALLLPCEHC